METNKELIKYHARKLEDFNPIHDGDKPVAQAFYTLTDGLCKHTRDLINIQNGYNLLCAYKITYNDFLIPQQNLEVISEPGLLTFKTQKGATNKIKYPLEFVDFKELESNHTDYQTAKSIIDIDTVKHMQRIFDPEEKIEDFGFYHILFPSFVTPGSIELNRQNKLFEDDGLVNMYASQEVYLLPEAISNHFDKLQESKEEALEFKITDFKKRGSAEKQMLRMGVLISDEQKQSLAYVKSTLSRLPEEEFKKLILNAYRI